MTRITPCSACSPSNSARDPSRSPFLALLTLASPTLHTQSPPPHLRSPPPSSSKSLVTLYIGPILVTMLRISTPSEQDQREPERIPGDQNRLPITRISSMPPPPLYLTKTRIAQLACQVGNTCPRLLSDYSLANIE